MRHDRSAFLCEAVSFSIRNPLGRKNNFTKKLELLNAIAEFITTTAQLARLDSKTTYKLRLPVDEIATNIIQYGYADTRGEITCYA